MGKIFYITPCGGSHENDVKAFMKCTEKIDSGLEWFYRLWVERIKDFKVLDRMEGGIYKGEDQTNLRSKQCRTYCGYRRNTHRNVLSWQGVCLSFIDSGDGEETWTEDEIREVYISFMKMLEVYICKATGWSAFPLDIREPTEPLYSTMSE